MAFVYHANYFVYFEMARAEMLREIGMPYTDWEERGMLLPVVESHCEYKTPAHFDDLLRITTICTGLRGARICFDYEIHKEDSLIVTGYTHHVCLSREGKVQRPLPELLALVTDAPSPAGDIT